MTSFKLLLVNLSFTRFSDCAGFFPERLLMIMDSWRWCWLFISMLLYERFKVQWSLAAVVFPWGVPTVNRAQETNHCVHDSECGGEGRAHHRHWLSFIGMQLLQQAVGLQLYSKLSALGLLLKGHSPRRACLQKRPTTKPIDNLSTE